MTRDEIIEAMLREEPYRIFRTMRLGGNTRQLEQMENEGLISSERRYRGRGFAPTPNGAGIKSRDLERR